VGHTKIRFAGSGTRWGRLLAYSAIVGVLSGLAAAGLEWALHAAVGAGIGRLSVDGPRFFPKFHWMIVVLPVAGGLLSGLVGLLGPRQSTDDVVRAFHFGGGEMSLRHASVNAAASVGVIGCGGSVGPESPIAALGAAVGSTLSRLVNLGARERRLLLLAGCGGGVGAIFHCPLGGALFATTILYRELDIEGDALLPSLITSVVSFATFTAFWGHGKPLLRGTDALTFGRWTELPAYALLALFCAAVAIFLYYCLRVSAGLRQRLKLPRWLTPMIGGLLVGGVALVVPQVMDARYGFIQKMLDGTHLAAESRTWLTWALFASIVVGAKCVATALTVGSGNHGGLLGPTVFIGGAVGAATGALLEVVFPGLVPEPLRRALIPLGMAGMLAASWREPLAAIVMVTEMTGSFGLVVPLMLVSGVAYYAGRRWGLSQEQVGSPSDSPVHAGEAVVNLLDTWRAKDFVERAWPFVVSPSTTLPEMVAKMPPGSRPTFAVVEGGRVAGVVSTQDVAEAAGTAMTTSIVAADLMDAEAVTVREEDDLYGTLEVFLREGVDVLPVVGGGDSQFVGMLTRGAIVAALQARMSEQRAHLLREHAPIAMLAGETQIEQMISELPAARRGTVQRMAVPEEIAGRSLRECDFRRRFGRDVIAVQTGSGEVIAPPDPGRALAGDDVLIVLEGKR
jgi:CIC family chloride channel protein